MARINLGPSDWSLTRDNEGFVAIRVTYKIRTNDPNDGPTEILQTDGLPEPGDPWVIGNEDYPGAICRLDADVKKHPTHGDEPGHTYLASYVFSDKPLPHCQDPANLIEDPLLWPQEIRGGHRIERTSTGHDRHGNPITSSAGDRLTGPANEKEKWIGTVEITQYVPILELDVLEDLVGTVNENEMWGFEPRMVKFLTYSWDCVYYGAGCEFYYKRLLRFEIDAETWDRSYPDESQVVLAGSWSADGRTYVLATPDGVAVNSGNPLNAIVASDARGKPRRYLLDGQGRPANVLVKFGGSFMSLTAANLGNELNDNVNWLPIVGDPLGSAWNEFLGYKRGNVVVVVAAYYIAIKDVEVGDGIPPSLAPTKWLSLGGIPTDVGAYAVGTSYARGNYVIDSGTLRPPGTVHVEHHDEGDFLTALGVPAVIECQVP